MRAEGIWAEEEGLNRRAERAAELQRGREHTAGVLARLWARLRGKSRTREP